MGAETGENTVGTSDREKRFLTISLYAFGFLDLFAVALIIPISSRQATNLGASPAAVGLVGTIYGTLQLISAPFVGRWSDVGGRRRTLLLCLFFTSVGYYFMGISTSVVYYLLARLPLGIFKHSVAITKALLAEITPKEERPKVFGYFNGISSAGFIVGPLIGGHLAETENGFYKVSVVTSLIFASCFLFVLFFINPDSHSDRGGLPATKSVADFTREEYAFDFFSSLHTFWGIVRTAPDVFLARLLHGFSATLFRSNFSLTLEQRFDATPVLVGRIISFGSLASAAAGLGVGRLRRLYGGDERRLFLHACTVRVIAFTAILLSPSVPAFLACYALLTTGGSVARVCSMNLSIRRGRVGDTGALLGLNQSLMSVCRTVSPLIAGFSQELSSAGPVVLSIALSIVGTGIIARTDFEDKELVDGKKTE